MMPLTFLWLLHGLQQTKTASAPNLFRSITPTGRLNRVYLRSAAKVLVEVRTVP
jgi:hypothetical protein